MNREQLAEQGAVRLCGAAAPFLAKLEALLEGLPKDRAGVRLHGLAGLAGLLAPTALGRSAKELLGPKAAPVRATLFDKSPAVNWTLGWHQDRTIAVVEQVATPGFGPWSVKSGMVHVEPPFELLERMFTIRIHFDPVGPDNGPLRIAVGSHRLGRIAEADVATTVKQCGVASCPAERGDIWLYATPILHASHAAIRPSRRRVLQVDYSADPLPAPLQWLGL